MLTLKFTKRFVFECTKIMICVPSSKGWLGLLFPTAQKMLHELTCNFFYYSVRSPFANKVPTERITIGAFAASGDKTVRVWDAKSNKPVTTVTTKVRPSFKCHPYSVNMGVPYPLPKTMRIRIRNSVFGSGSGSDPNHCFDFLFFFLDLCFNIIWDPHVVLPLILYRTVIFLSYR